MAAKKKTPTSGQKELTPSEIMNSINAIMPGAVTVASDPELSVTRWPTGVAPLDYALDGGLPRGRFIEVYGPYSVLKSWWAYKAIASVQSMNGKVALIDTEHSWDADWGAQIGIDTSSLLVVRPNTAEEAIIAIQTFITQKYDLVVFDSIAAAIPSQQADAMPGEDNAPGALARVMSKGLARLNAANKHTAVFCINQTREKIGVSFGSPTTTSGGKAMGYYASYRLSFVRTGKVKHTEKVWDGEKMTDGYKVTAHKIKATLEKSKLSAPHSDVQFLYDLEAGEVDTVNWLVGQGLETGLISMGGGGYYDIPGVLTKKIQGYANFIAWLNKNEDVIEWLSAEIIPQSNLSEATA